MKYLALLMLCALTACAHAGVVETQYKTVTKTVRGPCPEPKTYQQIKSSRPVPLRKQAMPGTAAERVAQQSAQLGEYEGEGKWADKVMSVLDRCQSESEDLAEPDPSG